VAASAEADPDKVGGVAPAEEAWAHLKMEAEAPTKEEVR
jgi:hypothetical protein